MPARHERLWCVPLKKDWCCIVPVPAIAVPIVEKVSGTLVAQYSYKEGIKEKDALRYAREAVTRHNVPIQAMHKKQQATIKRNKERTHAAQNPKVGNSKLWDHIGRGDH